MTKEWSGPTVRRARKWILSSRAWTGDNFAFVRLFVATPTMHPEMVQRNVIHCLNAAEADAHVDLLLFENGCSFSAPPENPRGEVYIEHSDRNIGVCPALHVLYEKARELSGSEEFVIGFLHDDVKFYEPWVRRTLSAFDHEDVVIAGPAAGLCNGHPDTNAENTTLLIHRGTHLWKSVPDYSKYGVEPCDYAREAAVVDGMALFVRGSFLWQIGGFDFWRIAYHAYDHAICAMARRHRRRIAYVPILCAHFGRPTKKRADFARDLPVDGDFWRMNSETCRQELKKLYDMFQDVLPYEVEGAPLT